MENTQDKSSNYTSLFYQLELFSNIGHAEHFRQFNEVSEALMAGYANIVRQGMPREMVGLAMLSAMLNLYDIFEMQFDLPRLLREAADRVEHETSRGHH